MRLGLGHTLRRLDALVGRIGGGRRVLFETRSPLNLGVLRPVIDAVRLLPRVEVQITHDGRDDIRRALGDAGLEPLVVTREAARWRRFDLYVNADPWAPARLHRVARRLNFFHGVAGKYNLDCPPHDASLFPSYDIVAFANGDRMRRYIEGGVVTRGRAALVGYPKLDALVRGAYDAAAIRASLGFEPARPTVIYAPTWSPVSSLHLAGEAIIAALLGLGCNVIAKLHDNCFLLDEKYAAGIDWRARLARFASSGRFALVEAADASPYLAAADAMVTDHSSIGFEFLTLDRPLVVFDAPDLPSVARINPEKIALLRSAATVVSDASQLAPVIAAALAAPAVLSDARRRVAAEMFFQPGTATDRALAIACQLLDLPEPSAAGGELTLPAGSQAW